ncbi:hypothetical protein [Butyrivibrio sp. AC2005]|uniref:hypothetical protein n=1 Tax=Butyrivibrio sp. AC2005 TaxID=1280672 RepID=UPI00040E5134|nr:hypothetical protein [Butyrivibrio sp. AC2005]
MLGKNNNSGTKYYLRILAILLADAFSVVAAHLLSLLVRFDFRYGDIPQLYKDNLVYMLPVAVVIPKLP